MRIVIKSASNTNNRLLKINFSLGKTNTNKAIDGVTTEAKTIVNFTQKKITSDDVVSFGAKLPIAEHAEVTAIKKNNLFVIDL